MKTAKRFPGHRNPPKPPQQNTLNRDKVMDIVANLIDRTRFVNVSHLYVIEQKEHLKKDITNAICSLSLPTDDFKGLENSFFFKGSKSTLSEGEYTKIGKPDDCDVESCVGPDCEGCQRFQPKLITNALSEGEINPFPKSLYPDHHKAWEIGYKAAIKQLTKPKEER